MVDEPNNPIDQFYVSKICYRLDIRIKVVVQHYVSLVKITTFLIKALMEIQFSLKQIQAFNFPEN